MVIAINKSWRCDDDGDGDDMGGLPPAPPRQPLPSFALFCLLQLHLARSICTTQTFVRIADGGLNDRRGRWGLCKPARVERGPPTCSANHLVKLGLGDRADVACRSRAWDHTHGMGSLDRLIAMFEHRGLCRFAVHTARGHGGGHGAVASCTSENAI